jgi:N-acyl homoserine lactone hydrolase
MGRLSTMLPAGAPAALLLAAFAQAADMSVTRLDCGTPETVAVNQYYSDTFALGDMKRQFVFSCYLIKHADNYLLWDTGHAMTEPKVAPKVSIVDQLATLGIKPDQIKYVGISHYHFDHVGQVGSFPKAVLLIGTADWDAIIKPNPVENIGVTYKPFEPWTKGDSKVEPVATDRDVFGDGSVIMLATPGHTPGHHSLLVKLATRSLILSGDAAHFRENWDADGVPWYNYNRAATIASIERLKQLAANLHATVIIQHDPRDVSKLPPFPQAAK